MAFINWSDSEEMLGLLTEYVADARSDSQDDPSREDFMAQLLTELADLTDQLSAMSADEAIERLRAIHAAAAGEFVDDPVLSHVKDCIEELVRIRDDSVA